MMSRLMNLLCAPVSLAVFLGMTTQVLAGPTPTPTATPTPSDLTLTVSVDTPDPIVPGQTGAVVTIAANEALEVGSTDITFNWDVAGIPVDNASSSVLSAFTASIDNPTRTVVTAFATSGIDSIPAGTPLMTFMLTANEPAACTNSLLQPPDPPAEVHGGTT
jgi:hypothetical protein